MRWAETAVVGTVGGETVVWADDGLVHLPPLAAVVADYFDGATPLVELVEDAAFASGLSQPAVWEQLLDPIDALLNAGALVGSTAAPPHEVHAQVGVVGDEGHSDVVNVEVVKASDGSVVTTEYLRNGQRRVSSTLQFGSAARDSLVAGDRSLAEMIPRDSCLGSKLRNDESVPLLTFRCSDGRLRSVRCHSPEVADLLRSRGAQVLVGDGSGGAIVVFVVTPLEGLGPLRVYDARGQRVGRPRSIDEAADIADSLLAAHRWETSGVDAGMPLRLRFHTVTRGNEQCLIPEGLMLDRSVARLLRSRGWSMDWGHLHLERNGTVHRLTELGGASPPLGSRILVGGDARPFQLLPYIEFPEIEDRATREQILQRACEFADRAELSVIRW